jgi:hypothetical protein
MKKLLFVTIFFLGYLVSGAQDYNKLDPEYTSLAKDALSKLSEPTRQWFIDKSKEHPAGNFDAAWTKTQLTQKFGADQTVTYGEIFALMIAYQKLMNKEVREDRRLSRDDKKLELQLKEAKLEKDNKAIDAGMSEAKEKADIAMTAATTSQAIGVAQGTTQIASVSNNTATNKSAQTKPVKPEEDPKTKSMIKLRSQLSDLNRLKL